jgi:SAM-dependent methyltransferase
MRDVIEYNSSAWDNADNRWTVPVGSEEIADARRGDWQVILTPVKPVPSEWFGDLAGKDVLCLASGGGQQAPILAAAGARVTSFDNSAGQLERDMFVADRDGLDIRIEKGDSADLSRFADESFDLIFHPCSNCFMPKLQAIWDESFRILRSGGAMLIGFTKPEVYIFDRYKEEQGVLKVCNRLPYSDLEALTKDDIGRMIKNNEPMEYSHTLEEQIGGLTAAGFHIVGYYDDYWRESDERPLNKFMPSFGAVRAVKP